MRRAILFALLGMMLACTGKFECETTITRYYYQEGKLLFTSEETESFSTNEWSAGETGYWTYEPSESDTLDVMVLEATSCNENQAYFWTDLF